MDDLKRIADDLRAVLSSISQATRRDDPDLFDAVDGILAESGERLTASRETVAEDTAWHLLSDCAVRIGFGRVLTGIHREYMLAVINKLLDPKTGSVREVMTFSTKRGKVKRFIRTHTSLRSDPEHPSDEELLNLVHDRMDGRRMNLPACERDEAIKWIGENILYREKGGLTKRVAEVEKAHGIVRPRGRPRKLPEK
jgi:hypothetical protein